MSVDTWAERQAAVFTLAWWALWFPNSDTDT